MCELSDINQLQLVPPPLPNQILTPEEMPVPVVCNPINSEWKARLTDKWWASNFEGSLNESELKAVAANRELIKMILAFGGEEVCMPIFEEDYQRIKDRGIFLYGNKAEFVKGNPSQCHANSAEIWYENQERFGLMTGYALSSDGMWRQHSWCVIIDNGIVLESTEPRVGYFGFLMTNEEAETFYWNNN